MTYMPSILYAYVIVSCAGLVVFRSLFVVVQPALLGLYFVAAEVLG
jgi:hypothetical protein